MTSHSLDRDLDAPLLAHLEDTQTSGGSETSRSDTATGRIGGKASINKYANLSKPDCNERFSEDRHTYRGPGGWFVTSIADKDGDGEPVWDARRHRRNRPQQRPGRHDKDSDNQGEGISAVDSRQWGIATVPQAKDVLWWISAVVGPCFVLGSALYLMGGIAGMFPGNIAHQWSTRRKDWLQNIPNLIGALFFYLGAYATLLEVANVDYRSKCRSQAGGRQHGNGFQPPTLDLAPFPTHMHSAFISYYGALLQYCGAVLYVVGRVAQALASHLSFSSALSTCLITSPYIVGGAFFVAGGYLMAAEVRHTWARGLLPPGNFSDVGEWIQFLNLFGSVLFFAGGLCLCKPVGDGDVWQFYSEFGFVWGAFVFLVQAVLQTLETVHPDW